MWTAISLSATHVWDDVLWHATATWKDDLDDDGIVLVLAGRAPLHGQDSPTEILLAATRAFEVEADAGSVRLRDGASPVDS
jgi:hypothetical protein